MEDPRRAGQDAASIPNSRTPEARKWVKAAIKEQIQTLERDYGLKDTNEKQLVSNNNNVSSEAGPSTRPKPSTSKENNKDISSSQVSEDSLIAALRKLLVKIDNHTATKAWKTGLLHKSHKPPKGIQVIKKHIEGALRGEVPVIDAVEATKEIARIKTLRKPNPVIHHVAHLIFIHHSIQNWII